MKRITSTNPNRTENGRDGFDYAKGAFLVKEGTKLIERIPYSGNNMQESKENYRAAWRIAQDFAEKFRAVGKHIEIEEIEENR